MRTVEVSDPDLDLILVIFRAVDLLDNGDVKWVWRLLVGA